MDILIQNANDLKVEIARLKNMEVEQAVALKLRFASPRGNFFHGDVAVPQIANG
jgi:hypothetical protein